jgi:hypothetical protein
MIIQIDFIAGLVFGIEHISGDEEDEFNWVVGIHVGFLRFSIFG